jgi:hypothetical protein
VVLLPVKEKDSILQKLLECVRGTSIIIDVSLNNYITKHVFYPKVKVAGT